MILSQPQYMWLLLLVPVFFLVQFAVLKLRQRRIRRFGDEALVNALMPSYAKGKVWVRLTFFALAFCMLVVAIARPQRGAKLKEQELLGAEVIIALTHRYDPKAAEEMEKFFYDKEEKAYPPKIEW